MNRSPQSPDLNPFENLWDDFAQQSDSPADLGEELMQFWTEMNFVTY